MRLTINLLGSDFVHVRHIVTAFRTARYRAGSMEVSISCGGSRTTDGEDIEANESLVVNCQQCKARQKAPA